MNCFSKLRKVFAIAIAVFASVLTANAYAASGLDGYNGNIGIYFPNASTVLSGGTPVAFTFGGPDISFVNVGGIDWTLHTSGNTMTFDFNDHACCTSPATFGGPVVKFTDAFFPSLSTVSLNSTNISGFGGSRVTFDSFFDIFVDISGGLDLRGTNAGLGTNKYVTLTVTAVPEPETYAMMFAGLGLLGFIGRRKQQSA